MTFIPRRAFLALFVLSALVLSTAAQDGVKVVGSGVAGQLWQSVVGDETIAYDFAGTQNGLTAFCANNADIALANRPLSIAEASSCAGNSVVWSELLIGYDGYALVASPDVDFATCLTSANLDAVIAPSLGGSEIKWSAVNPQYPDLAITFVYPGMLSRPAALLDRVVRGEGFRSDATAAADSAGVIAEVAAGSGMLGLVSLTAALDAAGVTVLDMNNATLNSCIAPSAENALNRQYQGGDRLFAYVNVNAFEKPGVTEALDALTGPDAAAAITGAEFVPPTDALRVQAAAVVADHTEGRVFSNDVNTYQVTGDTTGTLRVGGAAAGVNYLKAALAVVTSRYSTITLEEHYLGELEGVREFCNGNRELIAISTPLTADQQANCDANSIDTFEVGLGSHAAVLVGTSASGYLSCVSTALIQSVFATSAEPIMTWSAYDAEFPDEPVYLFVTAKGDDTVDLTMIRATGLSVPVREDVQVNADAAYRANAVANTPGAIAIMSWAEAQRVVAEQAGVQVLSVQAEGGECVAPTLETLADGSYPLAEDVKLLVNNSALATDMVQATLYTLFGDDNYRLIEDAGLVGVSFADLVNIRANLVAAFQTADAAEAAQFALDVAATETALAPTVEATADGTATESTPDATTAAEPTAEPTPGQ